MAELAATAFASMFSAGAAGGAAVGGAAAGTAAVGAASAGVLGSLQGVLSTAAMISAGLGGVLGYQSKNMQADAQQIAAQAEAIRIKRDLVQKIGSARVAFAGSGLDISSAGAIESSLEHQADYEVATARENGALQASAYRAQGLGSLISAGGTIARDWNDLIVGRIRRGA